jgi:hypothetical protein
MIMGKIKSPLMQVGWFMGTIALSAAIMLAFYPVWLIVMLLAVLIAHEMGHFGAAKLLGAKSKLPFFIPLGPLVMGATWVQTRKRTNEIAVISMAGPFAGFLVAAAMFIALALVGSNIGAIFAVGLASREVLSATIGSDGRRFRKAKKGEKPLNTLPRISVPINVHADWSMT